MALRSFLNERKSLKTRHGMSCCARALLTVTRDAVKASGRRATILKGTPLQL